MLNARAGSDEKHVFNGLLFAEIDNYRRSLLTEAETLRLRIAATERLGELLTRDAIEEGLATIRSIAVRNDNPLFDPLFLTFLNHQDWIRPTDRVLCQLDAALGMRRKMYRRFVHDSRRQPMGGLFELNIFAALETNFPGVEPQPRLAGSTKMADFKFRCDGLDVFVEATVIDEQQFWKDVREKMRVERRSVFAAAGPGPAMTAFGIVSKVTHESEQTSPVAPNILCLSFFDSSASPMAREWAFDDLWRGGPKYGTPFNGPRKDFSKIERLDSVFEFSRDRLLNVHVNPHPVAACRLTDDRRDSIRAALGRAPLMIR